MVAASDCPAKAHLIGGRKASKPLMEKKRRARINECLDELKTLMENCYTNHIRKRKLEKADILEMTVKHLRYLHKVQQGVLKCTEYQAGFKSCLNGVNQFLLMTDNSSSRIQLNVLKHLSGHLFPGSSTSSSTLDSGTTEHGTSNSAALRQIRRPVWDTASGQCTANALPNACISNHRAPQATEMNVAEESKTQLCPGNIPQAIRDPSLLKEFCSITLQNYWRPW